MVLVDLNQILIGSIMMNLGQRINQINEQLVRHIILNILQSYNRRFGEYGKLVLCSDSKEKTWRKEKYPFYKAPRKQKREDSKKDWIKIYEIIENVKQELQENLPYTFIEFPGLEADDIMSIICWLNNRHTTHPTYDKWEYGEEKILILSSDKDLQQLQIYENVYQYSIMSKKFVECKYPTDFLLRHILKGDVSDGIPNVLSDDDTFIIEGKRQRPLRNSKLEEYLINIPNNNPNFKRNKELITLINPPEYLNNDTLLFESIIIIEDAFSQQIKTEKHKRANLLNYFISKNLNQMIDKIKNF